MRKVFKRTTVQFIRKTRLDNAARQLIKPHKPIIDIALKCGPSRPGGTCFLRPVIGNQGSAGRMLPRP
jgi:hypothetical protein